MAKRKKPKRKFSWYLAWFLIFSFFSAAGLVFLLTLPAWNIEDIKVSGVRFMSQDEIEKIAGRTIGKNIFLTDFSAVKKELGQISLIKKFRIRRSLPATLVIEISERREAAVAVIDNQTVLFDEDGIVLNLFAKYDLPSFSNLAVVTGLKGADISSGRLNHDTEELLSFVLKKVKKYVSAERIKINVASLENILLLVDDVILVKIGGSDELDKKLSAFSALRDFEQRHLNSIEYIDVQVPDNPVIKFK